MKKSYIAKALAFAAVLALALFLLAGCSGQEQEAEKIPFSQAIGGEGIHIWYECQNKIEMSESFGEEWEPAPVTTSTEYGRETRVVWVKVYENGTLTTYTCKKNVYLGYFARMSDEEIVTALKTDTDRFVCGQEKKPYKIYIYSDSTGHEIRFEGVPTIIKTGEDDVVTNEDGEEETLEEIPTYFMTLVTDDSIPTFQVYDSYYGGYELFNYDEEPFGGAIVVTRCEEGTVFGLDGLDLEGAVLDYDTPEDLLNEMNEPFREQRKERAEKYPTEEEEEEKASDAGYTYNF